MTAEGGPIVSIVTPSFNQGGYIAETIASILAQDYPHLDCVVVDGGSSDGTLNVLRRLGDNVRWVSEPDRGQSDAINKGWRSTRGEIIGWLNADDLYRPGAIRKVVAFFQQHPDVDLVYGDCEYINEAGNVIGHHPTRAASSVDLVRSAINYIGQPAAFFRRRVLDTIGYLDETLHFVMDFDFWLRIASRYQIAYLPDCLAAFRFHSESKSVQQSARMGVELLEVYHRLFASRDLPDGLRRVERDAMSNAYYRAADYHFLAGDMKQARRYALTGWRSRSWTLQRTPLKVLVLGLVGPKGARVAAWLKTLQP